MDDPLKILKANLDGLKLTPEQEDDLKATFEAVVDLAKRAAAGEDVTRDTLHVRAQVMAWKAGALSASQAALWSAAKDYADYGGAIIRRVVMAAVGGLI